MRWRLAVAFCVLAMLAGCAAPRKVVHLQSRFDDAEARARLSRGPNKIVGSALIRQRGGGVVTCAGNNVALVPATDYASERMKHLYGSDQFGYLPVFSPLPRFEPDYPGYSANMRITACDAQGTFEFDGLADGDYFIVTHIVWEVQSSYQGGALMQRVKVSKGETKKIVLAPK